MVLAQPVGTTWPVQWPAGMGHVLLAQHGLLAQLLSLSAWPAGYASTRFFLQGGGGLKFSRGGAPNFFRRPQRHLAAAALDRSQASRSFFSHEDTLYE